MVGFWSLTLSIGRKLADELARNRGFQAWRNVAVQYGKIRDIERSVVEQRTQELRERNACESDDAHVMALAQISGARLLYSNDKTLQNDFRSRFLLSAPSGKVYSTRVSRKFGKTHKRLLADRSLCKVD